MSRVYIAYDDTTLEGICTSMKSAKELLDYAAFKNQEKFDGEGFTFTPWADTDCGVDREVTIPPHTRRWEQWIDVHEVIEGENE